MNPRFPSEYHPETIELRVNIAVFPDFHDSRVRGQENHGKSVDLRRNSYIHLEFMLFLMDSSFPWEVHPETIELRVDITVFA